MKHAAGMLVLFLHACTRWTPVPLQPAQVPAAGAVRATLRTGQQVIFSSAVIAGDTLRDATAGGVPGIPLAQIAALDVQRSDAAATVAVVVIGGLAFGELIVLAVLKSIEAGLE